ncbi:MAG: HAMP domain-containing sensor histidine kinase [Nitrospinae bacterium]|jgi:two-component system, OmpR family, sensor histidine kinase VicK|nr:HAMP domain-containing sensor histidine kinase [Nitrospinota bacterium]MDA1110513.1 HAMP domain-containing sensor histidine kinase [Nitrospinota bacterium]
MSKLKALFHPIFIFVGIQVAWIVLMAVWINWYLKNSRKFQEFAQKIRPDLFADEFNWIILLEGCFLMLIILAGVYIIFVYWNKQARLNKLQSNFVSSVSHELKSPLASIQLYLETLKYQEVSKEDSEDFVETMLTDTERLASLIDNILASSKYDPKSMQLQFQPVEMGAFIREVVLGLKRQFEERNCQVKLEGEEDLILLLDQRAMRMVFNNLIGNALRYSPVGSPLTIRMQKNKKYCEIEFIDQGMGLDKRDMKKIFKKFYRVTNKDSQNIEGAGLGLFISNEIVRSHKGQIRVFSEGRGKGSVFTVALPLNRVVKRKAAVK